LKALHENMEMVFVSSDRDEESFNAYFKKMSFCALPYEHRKAKEALSKMFEVEGIPMLAMLGPQGEDGERPLINSNVRGYIESESFEEFPFHKKNYGDINSAEDVDEVKSLIIFHENGDDEEQDLVKKVAKQVAAKFEDKEGEDAYNVNWALSDTGIAPRVRSLAKLPSAAESEDAVMILLDIPDNGGYYKSDITDLTFENAIKFLESPGERFQLG
jgi:hypothetical protein